MAVIRMDRIAGEVYSLALSPDFPADGIAFASLGRGVRGRPGGLYWTADGGRSWEPAGGVMAGQTVTAIAVSPRYAEDGQVLAATLSGAVVRSDDGGVTWERIGTAPGDRIVYSLCHAGGDEGFGVWLAATGAGLFRSADGGATWDPWGGTAVEASDRPAHSRVSRGGRSR